MKISRVAVCGLWIALISVLAAATVKAQTTQPTTTQPDMSAAVEPAAPRNVPVHFARSGHAIELEQPLTFSRPIKTAVLRAYDRTWTEPFAVGGNGMVLKMKVTVPKVRVPTVFSVTWPEPPYLSFAEVIAYPERDVNWDKKLTLYACGAPAWFDQWAAAVGLPVKQVAKRELPSAKLAPDEEGGKSLLILGSATAGKDLADVSKLADDKKINILVLDTGWFGEAAGEVSVAPAQMRASLSDISKQKWPQPLKFTARRKPWPGIANRWAWITDDAGLSLVETIALVHGSAGTAFTLDYDYGKNVTVSGPVVLSYVPWCEQLGRREHADELMLATLKSAANEPQWKLPKVAPTILWVEDGPLEAKDRPVLAAVPPRYRIQADNEKVVYILDVRGKQKIPQGFPRESLTNWGDEMDRLPEKDKGRVSMLMLGDDKLLDEMNLKLDREKKRIGRAGVQWLPADELPPSKDDQIRLMLKLTELGVPLAPR